MATLYLKAAGGNWTSAGTWSATGSGGSDSAGPPTAADNCIAESGSGNVTVNSASCVCRSFDTTSGTGSWSGTLSHLSSSTLTIGDATAGAGNVALKFNSGMTYSPQSPTFSIIAFASTSATQQTVDTVGKTMSNINFIGSGSNYAVVSALIGSAAMTVTQSNGTVHYDGASDSSGLAHGFGIFNSNNSNVRTVALGTCTMLLASASNAWNMQSVTNLTMASNTAFVTCSGAAGTFLAATINLNGTSLVLSGSGTPTMCFGTAIITMANFTRTGTASKLDGLIFGGNLTCTGTFTVTGNSAVNRLLVSSGGGGLTRTITAATVSSNACDFQDIHAAGTGNWNLSGASNYTGDCGGNTGITTTTSATQTSSGTGSFTWSNSAIWTSRVPLPQDDVVVSNAFTGTPTITMDMPRMGRSVDFSGGSGSQPTMTAIVSYVMFGSLTLRSGGTYFNTNLTFEGRGNYTLTTNGVTMPSGNLQLLAPGGKLTQQDNLTWSGTANWLVAGGEWDTNGFNITATNSGGAASHSGTGIITIVNSTISFAYTGTLGFWLAQASNTVNASGSAIILAAPSANNRTFTSANQVYGELRYNVANSPGALIISGVNSFQKLTLGTNRMLTIPSAHVTTIGGWSGMGQNNGYLALPGVDGNSAYTPSSAALQITGAITIDAKIAPASWTPPNHNVLAAKYDAINNLSYMFHLSATTGFLVFTSSPNGTGVSSIQIFSSVATGFTDGSTNWVRVSFQPNDGPPRHQILHVLRWHYLDTTRNHEHSGRNYVAIFS